MLYTLGGRGRSAKAVDVRGYTMGKQSEESDDGTAGGSRPSPTPPSPTAPLWVQGSGFRV